MNSLYDGIEDIFNPTEDKIQVPRLKDMLETTYAWPNVIFRVRKDILLREADLPSFLNNGRKVVETPLSSQLTLYLLYTGQL